jgi:Na+/glutamate symporter
LHPRKKVPHTFSKRGRSPRVRKPMAMVVLVSCSLLARARLPRICRRKVLAIDPSVALAFGSVTLVGSGTQMAPSHGTSSADSWDAAGKSESQKEQALLVTKGFSAFLPSW